jgi:ABC-type Fe3+ transport system substrate-binding protein
MAGLVASLWMLALSAQAQNHVVVISPHNEAIRIEFARAYADWHRAQYHEESEVEWRDVGGSTDAMRFVLSEFASKPGGIGIDCFFGGGIEPFLMLADRGLCETYVPTAAILDGIPQNWKGVDLYDAGHRWYGTALSSFGILQNKRVQKLMGLPAIVRWDQLADPALQGWVGVGDPRNSGSMSTMFETLLQAYGWERGWQLLARLSGNARRFDRFSSNTAKDVTLGETACAPAIDFYAFTQIAAAGRAELVFALPEDVAGIVPDGLALLKGAPHAVEAKRFVDFVLSETGQKLWYLPKGYQGGARQFSIERMPVRPDLYKRYHDVSNIEYSPFDLKQTFKFDGNQARARGDLVAAMAGALLVDVHPELRSAWQAVIRRGCQSNEVARLGQAPLAEQEALVMAKGQWKEPAFRNRKKIEWQRWALEKYRELQ